MRIRQDETPVAKSMMRRAVAEIHQECPAKEPVCCADCPDYNPKAGCHQRCSQMAIRLSSEGASYPLEPRIAPLVFELTRLGVFQPCWSCEGHNDPGGRLWKIPRIWFYASSVYHLRVLAGAIERMTVERMLNARWRVLMTNHNADQFEPTLSLEPLLDNQQPGLTKLQQDAQVIANLVVPYFLAESDKLARNTHLHAQDVDGEYIGDIRHLLAY